MNKQIEEMAKVICCDYGKCGSCGISNPECETPCTILDDCEALYNAGYRKQIEGEWAKKYDKAPRFACSACNHLFNNKSFKYCPHCGAKMKGGE